MTMAKENERLIALLKSATLESVVRSVKRNQKKSYTPSRSTP